MSSPDYYKTLGIAQDATQQQIRSAYKRESLKSHPDRVPIDSPERPSRTRKFQEINDAYYTLSDPARRREYDATRAYQAAEEEAEAKVPPTGAGGFPWSSFGFGGNRDDRDNDQFGSVFEEMLREEGLAEENEEKAGDGLAQPGDSGHWLAVSVVVLWASLLAIFLVRWRALLLVIVSARSAMLRAKVSMRFSWTFQRRIGRGS
ncbi:Heat shock protein DnaJ N-terminal [Penicillium expansum]|nr:Heat shock protein DnaJ N-terminal [Penicillium expansum]